MKLPNLYSEVGWNRELFVPMSVIRHRDFFVVFFPVFLFDSNALKLKGAKQMSKKLTVQDMILTLQKFWSSNGCMLMQAYDTEKGAGTMSHIPFYGQSDQNHGMLLT